jgi:uncharacterized membrane protein
LAFVHDVRHVVHHRWFYIAYPLEGCATAGANFLDPAATISIGGDVFYGTHLLFVATDAVHVTPTARRKRAASDDQGIILIAIITLVAFCLMSLQRM